MADPTAFYEPEEDELLSSLAVPNYAEGDYDEEYRQHMQELEQHAFAQHQEQEQAQALESVPEDVKRVGLSECGANTAAAELRPFIAMGRSADDAVLGSLPPGHSRERPTGHHQHVRVGMEQAHPGGSREVRSDVGADDAGTLRFERMARSRFGLVFGTERYAERLAPFPVSLS